MPEGGNSCLLLVVVSGLVSSILHCKAMLYRLWNVWLDVQSDTWFFWSDARFRRHMTCNTFKSCRKMMFKTHYSMLLASLPKTSMVVFLALLVKVWDSEKVVCSMIPLPFLPHRRLKTEMRILTIWHVRTLSKCFIIKIQFWHLWINQHSLIFCN